MFRMSGRSAPLVEETVEFLGVGTVKPRIAASAIVNAETMTWELTTNVAVGGTRYV